MVNANGIPFTLTIFFTFSLLRKEYLTTNIFLSEY